MLMAIVGNSKKSVTTNDDECNHVRLILLQSEVRRFSVREEEIVWPTSNSMD